MLTALASLATLAGCAAPLSSGVVIDKDYYEAHSYSEIKCEKYLPVARSAGCVKFKEVVIDVPDRWTVSVSAEGNQTATFWVDEATYDSAESGYLYDSETGKLTTQ